jgi:hypothetical protein
MQHLWWWVVPDAQLTIFLLPLHFFIHWQQCVQLLSQCKSASSIWMGGDHGMFAYLSQGWQMDKSNIKDLRINFHHFANHLGSRGMDYCILGRLQLEGRYSCTFGKIYICKLYLSAGSWQPWHCWLKEEKMQSAAALCTRLELPDNPYFWNITFRNFTSPLVPHSPTKTSSW